jgi:hypothetical protein
VGTTAGRTKSIGAHSLPLASPQLSRQPSTQVSQRPMHCSFAHVERMVALLRCAGSSAALARACPGPCPRLLARPSRLGRGLARAAGADEDRVEGEALVLVAAPPPVLTPAPKRPGKLRLDALAMELYPQYSRTLLQSWILQVHVCGGRLCSPLRSPHPPPRAGQGAGRRRAPAQGWRGGGFGLGGDADCGRAQVRARSPDSARWLSPSSPVPTPFPSPGLCAAAASSCRLLWRRLAWT